MRMIKQSLNQRPGFSAIIGLEERAWLYTTVQLVRLVCIVCVYVPDIFQCHACFLRKFDGVSLRLGYGLAVIIARQQHRTPSKTLLSPPPSMPDLALIKCHVTYRHDDR